MKLAVFGCGRIANRIALSALKVKEIDLVGFASKDIEKAKEYAKTYGCREYGDGFNDRVGMTSKKSIM
jgi:predicted dehydrogenase